MGREEVGGERSGCAKGTQVVPCQVYGRKKEEEEEEGQKARGGGGGRLELNGGRRRTYGSNQPEVETISVILDSDRVEFRYRS